MALYGAIYLHLYLEAPLTYRTYDHRIKRMISKSGDPNLFPQLEIPKTTALNWIMNPLPEVVTLPELNTESEQLINEIQALKQKLGVSEAKHQVSWSTFRLFGLQVQYKRIGSDSTKRKLVPPHNSSQAAIGI